MKNRRISKLGDQALFTLPTIIVFSMTVLIPFIFGIYMSFMKVPTVISPMKPDGFGNYAAVFKDKQFWDALWLTFRYVGASVIFVNLVGFSLAWLVTSGIKGQNFFRTSLFTPNLIGGLLLGYIWQFIFVQTLPIVGEKLNIELLKLGWLGDQTSAFWALVLVTVWQLGGYMMIIFIAGLISIPKDVIEASTIDGANAWQRLKSVTMPLMVPAFVVTIFMTLKTAFTVYDINYALTDGAPFNSTMMVSLRIVRKAFVEFGGFGVGQAEAVFLFVIVAVIAGVQVYYGKKREVQA